MGPFQRTNARMDQLGFVRGPARVLAAPLSTAPPDDIGDIIKVTGAETSEVQTLTITGTPTGGTFRLSFRGQTTEPIAYNAAASAVQAALEALTTVSTGNVVAAGGALPGAAVTLTFGGALANFDVPMVQVTSAALTGGSTPAATVAETTKGSGMFDPLNGWYELGGTKNGVVPSFNNTEEEFTIDQQQVVIGTLPNTFDWAFQTSLVEVTPENLAFAWDMGPVTLNAVPAVPEKKMGFGTPKSYTIRRIAIVHRRPQTGGLRAHFFRQMVRSPIDASLTYASTGEQQSVPLRMRALVDELISDDFSNVGYLLDQQV
jgi:hypothetical protein